MSRILKAFAAFVAAALFSTPVFATANSGFATSTGTIAVHILAAGTNWPTEWVQFCGYNACDDHGGGLFHRESCTPDAIFCITDSVGHTFERMEPAPGGVFDGHRGGLWLDGTHTDNISTINAVLAAATAHGASTVALCGQTLAGADADLLIPANLTLDLCGQPAGSRNNLDYRLSTGVQGILALPSTHTIIPGAGSAIENGTIERAGDTYAPATFKPVTNRDMINVQQNFAGTAITISAAQVKLFNLQILGFTNCISATRGGKQHIWDHLYQDCTNPWSIDSSSDITQMSNMTSVSYLNRGSAVRGDLWNLINSSGSYKAVIGIDSTTLQLVNGDVVFVGTAIGGGGQSAGGKWTLTCSGNCVSVPNGTDLCATAAGCQEAILTGSSSGAISMTATWISGLRLDGTPNPLITASDLSNVAVGQTLAGNCDDGVTSAFTPGTTVQDVWTEQGMVFPSSKLLCAGTAKTITATDGSFTHDSRGVEVSPVQRNGTCLSITNSGGITISNLHCYTHDIELHCSDGCNLTRITDFSTGENDPLGDEDNIAVLCDGSHVGDDCSDLAIKGGVLGQHTTKAFYLNTDARGIIKLDTISFGPGSGKKNGELYNVEGGNLVVSNSGAGVRGNIFVATQSAFYSTIYPDPGNGNFGTGFTAGDVVTVSQGTCSTFAQLTIDTVDSSGVPVTWHQSRAGVCSAWHSSPMMTTGGTGSGLKVDIDGSLPSFVNMVNTSVAQADVYVQTPGSTPYSGSNNTCLIMTACNMQQVVGVAGLGNFYGGLNIQGTENVQNRSSVRMSGTITPSISGSVVSSFVDVQKIAPTSTATAVVTQQMITPFGACLLCDTSSTFGLSVWSGHIIIDSTWTYGAAMLPNIWTVNPAAIDNSALHFPVADSVIYAGPGGDYFGQSGETGVEKGEFISGVGATTIPGIGGTFTATTANFGVPTGSPNAAGSQLNARALTIFGTCGTASGGAGLNCLGIFESSLADNQFAGDLKSNNSNGWRFISNYDSTGGALPDIIPNRSDLATGLGVQLTTVHTWALIANSVHGLWGDDTHVVATIALSALGGLAVGLPTGGVEGTTTINVQGAYYQNGTIGVTCSGSPTSSFASALGIVTHC